MEAAALLRGPPAVVAALLLSVDLAPHLHVANALVDAYAKLPRAGAAARAVFDEMAHRDVVTWPVYGGKGAGTLMVESEVGVKDDLMEPISEHAQTEPQESAGSNSSAGNAWTCSWEPNSVDSTDRTRTASQSYKDDEVEQSWQSKQKTSSYPWSPATVVLQGMLRSSACATARCSPPQRQQQCCHRPVRCSLCLGEFVDRLTMQLEVLEPCSSWSW
ncbi:unnamed protein product [Miscanthus lutarioriparius]|uniref:Uncharacterized protein n=1 Tax=Miscanthus lutarioriparius TaxID=422564 RepID=A0A811MZP0_9POAL|nr:unnamed protein product [Miscanthus lutarioriparius]